jgi:hypothetical protein
MQQAAAVIRPWASFPRPFGLAFRTPWHSELPNTPLHRVHHQGILEILTFMSIRARESLCSCGSILYTAISRQQVNITVPKHP